MTAKKIFKELVQTKEGKTSITLISIGVIGAICVAVFIKQSKFLLLLEIIFSLFAMIGVNRFSTILTAISETYKRKK